MNTKKIACIVLLTYTMATSPFSFLDFGTRCLSVMRQTGSKVIQTMCRHKVKSCLIGATTAVIGGIITLFAKRNALMHYACKQNNKDLVECAIIIGADPNCKDPQGRTPLLIAAANNATEASEALLTPNCDELNIDMSQTDSQHMNPLMHAAQNGSLPNTELYLHNIQQANKPEIIAAHTPENKTALTLALEYNHEDVAQLIIDICSQSNNPRVNEIISIPDPHGMTPLMYAAQNGLTHVVQHLLDENVDPTVVYRVTDHEAQIEKTALVFASEQGHEETVLTILSHSDYDSFAQQRIEVAIARAHSPDIKKLIQRIKDVTEKSRIATNGKYTDDKPYHEQEPQLHYYTYEELEAKRHAK